MSKNINVKENKSLNLDKVINEKEIDMGKENFILTYLKEKKKSILLLALGTGILIASILVIYSSVGYTK